MGWWCQRRAVSSHGQEQGRERDGVADLAGAAGAAVRAELGQRRFGMMAKGKVLLFALGRRGRVAVVFRMPIMCSGAPVLCGTEHVHGHGVADPAAQRQQDDHEGQEKDTHQ